MESVGKFRDKIAISPAKCRAYLFCFEDFSRNPNGIKSLGYPPILHPQHSKQVTRKITRGTGGTLPRGNRPTARRRRPLRRSG